MSKQQLRREESEAKTQGTCVRYLGDISNVRKCDQWSAGRMADGCGKSLAIISTAMPTVAICPVQCRQLNTVYEQNASRLKQSTIVWCAQEETSNRAQTSVSQDRTRLPPVRNSVVHVALPAGDGFARSLPEQTFYDDLIFEF